MHWLVEVSRVGDTAPSERYCIDARRWQSALQEARRLRGDSGPLPKLTIELLDEGYRAVDPALNVRYLVTEAPPGMPLTDSARVGYSTAPPPTIESGTPRPSSSPRGSSAATPSVSPGASSPAAPPPQASIAAVSVPAPLPILAQVIKQRDEKATAANPIAYRELALSVRPGALRDDVEALLLSRLDEARGLMPDPGRYVQIAVFDHMFVKRPVRPPLATLVWKDWRGEPQMAFPGFGESAEAPPPASLSTRAPSWMPRSDSRSSFSVPPAPPVPSDLLAGPGEPARSEGAAGKSVAPSQVASAESPRRAPSVAPAARSASVPPHSLSPAAVPRGKSTPPLGSAAVNPSPSVAPASPRASHPPRPDASAAPVSEPPRPSVIPQRVVSIGPSGPSSPPARTSVPPAEPSPPAAAASDEPTVVATEPQPTPLLVSVATVEPIPAPLVVAEPTPALEPSLAAAPAAPARTSEPPPIRRSDPATQRRSDPAVQRRSDPAMQRRSDPAMRRSDPLLGRRRAPGEDLIGDLFESIHELSFFVDLVSGADFVARTLADVIPCEAIAVHAFDLGRREFVVVRVRHPSARKALLHRTSDADPIVREIMRHRSVISNGASPLRSGVFAKLGVEVKTALTGSVRQGGRYLGLIELVNPAGGTPFHEGEASALEYVCEQFADFVASRPIVLDADVVLGQ
jgi:hypothetical protein